MNKERLSPNNIIWYNGSAWVIDTFTATGVNAHMFENPEITKHIPFESVKGIQLTIASISVYLGIKMERDTTNSELYDDWRDEKTHPIRILMKGWSNRPDENGLSAKYVHVDNECMDSIGSADLIYIHELQNFLNSIGYKR